MISRKNFQEFTVAELLCSALLVLIIGSVGLVKYYKTGIVGLSLSPSPKADMVEYRSDVFGFRVVLPGSWHGYTINRIKEDIYDITGETTTNNGVVDSLQIVEIHHPLEVPGHLRQAIPIMIFTLEQWRHVQNEEWSVGAAPIPPSELARNSVYVFALPARYNYAFPEGFEEVERIISGKPLTAFELK